jgi:hypothetical protein
MAESQGDGAALRPVAQLEEDLSALPVRRDLIRRPRDGLARLQPLYTERQRAGAEGELIDAAYLRVRLGLRPPGA